MNSETKNYLITGGAGFIGSHLVDSLLNDGNNVLVIDNFDDFYSRDIKTNNLSNALTFDTFQLVEGDIRDVNILNELFRNNHFDIVVHLAAKAGVRPSIENSPEYFDVNINGTLNILEAMKRYDVKNMIFASSSSVYGNNEKVPFSETDFVDNPISPYAATKKSGELLCHTYHHLYDFKINCLRFFTVYGPRQRPDLAIHKFSKKILSGESIPMFGDGTTKRDYTYIDDIIQGVRLSIENLNSFEVFNLGESRTITLKELITLLEKEIGKKAIMEKLPLQPGDVEQTYADISKAKELLQYDPQYEIEEGIKNFIKWLRE
ncbi:MAG: GDP-mannose 4,6-dehydratase [Bacteroidota bacterium]